VKQQNDERRCPTLRRKKIARRSQGSLKVKPVMFLTSQMTTINTAMLNDKVPYAIMRNNQKSRNVAPFPSRTTQHNTAIKMVKACCSTGGTPLNYQPYTLWAIGFGFTCSGEKATSESPGTSLQTVSTSVPVPILCLTTDYCTAQHCDW
jgi:hypothetical protein